MQPDGQNTDKEYVNSRKTNRAFDEGHSENNPFSGQYLCPLFQCRQPSQQNATSESSKQSEIIQEGNTKHFFLEQRH